MSAEDYTESRMRLTRTQELRVGLSGICVQSSGICALYDQVQNLPEGTLEPNLCRIGSRNNKSIWSQRASAAVRRLRTPRFSLHPDFRCYLGPGI